MSDWGYQARVHEWMLSCFGQPTADDYEERSFRFLEEALELVQSCGCTKDDALRLVDYVFTRPAGEHKQEVGGVMVCLSALCSARNIDMEHAGWAELGRCYYNTDKIRAKHASKPAGVRSSLPGVTEDLA